MNAEGTAAGREGAGREGAGREGAGRDGAGREGAGREGAGRDGAGRDGAGRDGAGRDGAGRDGAGRPADAVRPVLDAISGPWVYTGPFGTGAHLKYIANMLIAVHTVAAAEAMVLARRSGLDLELVQAALDNSIATSAIWKQRGPVMRERAWSPAPGPVDTLHPILEQIEDHAARVGAATPVFTSAKTVFDVAVDDGWGELDIACVHDQLAGAPPRITGIAAAPPARGVRS